MSVVLLDQPLGWRDVVAVANGARLELSPAAAERIARARRIVEAISRLGIRAYGVNTGVGALCDVIVPPEQQRRLSRNLLMSHAVGVGAPRGKAEVRAIMVAALNNYAHGHSGLRLELVERLIALLNAGITPVVPSQGSVGYLSHMAHIALVLIGHGQAMVDDELLEGKAALAKAGLAPAVLEAKEGLSLVNGTPCVTGLGALALARAESLLESADAIAAMSFENLHGQPAAFDEASLALRHSPGLQAVGKRLRALIAGSGLTGKPGERTQDPLSLRTIPHVHGAARDVLTEVGAVLDRELASVTDNPAIAGSEEAPVVHSEAHAVGAAIGLAMDNLAIAVAEVAAMSERRTDRLVNPLVSNLPAFLAESSGVSSGFMIAQYTALSLVAENRRLAAPASLDGGITSALQEDHLCHATPAALKALAILANSRQVLAIELLAAAQAYDLQDPAGSRAPATDALLGAIRARIARYADDRPLAGDIQAADRLLEVGFPG